MNYAYVAVVAYIIAWFLILRLELVSRYRFRAIDLLHERNMRLIGEGKFKRTSWDQFLNGRSYASMIFDLRKWKFEHFFPELNLVSANSEPPAT